MANKKETELDKARGQTEAQKAQDDYNKGDFQTNDPVTGEPRGKMGGHWQTEDDVKAAQFDDNADDGDNGIEATDAARKLAKKEGVNLSTVKGTGADGQITVDDVRNAKP